MRSTPPIQPAAYAAPVLASLPLLLIAALDPDHPLILAAAVVAIVVTIAHGAIDLLLSRARSPLRAVPGYLAGVLAMAALWWAVPAVALLVFFCVSALHFADNDGLAGSGAARRFEDLWRGIAPLWLAAFLQPDAMTGILADLSGAPTLAGAVTAALRSTPIAVVVAVALTAQIGFDARSDRRLLGLLDFAVLLAWFAIAPLVAAFAAYFAAIHGWRHLLAAARDPGINERLRANAASIAASVLVICGAALCAGVEFVARPADAPTQWTRALFMVLSCLALPHAIVVFRWRREAIP